ncbi:MAG: hypothetical protein AMXMBFR59_04070 [Rhodanobacteraceae bacterium]
MNHHAAANPNTMPMTKPTPMCPALLLSATDEFPTATVAHNGVPAALSAACDGARVATRAYVENGMNPGLVQCNGMQASRARFLVALGIDTGEHARESQTIGAMVRCCAAVAQTHVGDGCVRWDGEIAK